MRIFIAIFSIIFASCATASSVNKLRSDLEKTQYIMYNMANKNTRGLNRVTASVNDLESWQNDNLDNLEDILVGEIDDLAMWIGQLESEQSDVGQTDLENLINWLEDLEEELQDLRDEINDDLLYLLWE